MACYRTRADEEAERETRDALKQQERLAQLDAQLKLQVCCLQILLAYKPFRVPGS